MLKPSDIYVLAGVLAEGDDHWTYRELAEALGIPHPLVQRGLQRAEEAGLYSAANKSVHRANIDEFFQHALRFLAPAHLGSVVAGVPAAWAAPPMAQLIHESSDLPPVWPSAHGNVRGLAFPPLHESAIDASAKWPRLGELLSVIDSLRAGDVRVRSVAADEVAGWLRAWPAWPSWPSSQQTP